MKNTVNTLSFGTAKITLSDEQSAFIATALDGKNILVDACIGSGKTTAIQGLCQLFPSTTSILYLTYNRLLKLDAQKRITPKNVFVTNYHGFAYQMLAREGIYVGVPDLIQEFLRYSPELDHYDVLIIDEYQDIDQELADLLEIIKNTNPAMQIIAVGDMEQKIYDKTTLDIQSFIHQFLENYERLTFTQCFRLSANHAAFLGRVWGKTISGVNSNCIIEEKTEDEVIPLLVQYEPNEILCLGSRNRSMISVLNKLEEDYPIKFNKRTIYASISDDDSIGAAKPTAHSAIFTTFDSSKGLERRICVIFDFDESYWESRKIKNLQKYAILRNIFCVAASRGKERIIFVTSGSNRLSEQILSTPFETKFGDSLVDISQMFDFKYKENIEECFSLLKITKQPFSSESDTIEIENTDGLIDLSPCIGIYQEAAFFDNYDLLASIKLCYRIFHNIPRLSDEVLCSMDMNCSILYLVSLQTQMNRYFTQVRCPFIPPEKEEELRKRLLTEFSPSEKCQVPCAIGFEGKNGSNALIRALGYADVVKNDTVYELKFVSELTHQHFLQCACYMIALLLPKGILWNTRNNAKYKIEIPNQLAFLDSVARAISKNRINRYYQPSISSGQSVLRLIARETQEIRRKKEAKELLPEDSSAEMISLRNANNIEIGKDTVAIIDTETTFKNKLLSIGVIVADPESLALVGYKYYIITPECYDNSMYSCELFHKRAKQYRFIDRTKAKEELYALLKQQRVAKIYAYNASFDYALLPETWDWPWYDIMKIAANRNTNKHIPANAPCYSTGKLKSNYGAEAIYRLLTNDSSFVEPHNALLDALCELEIIRRLGLPLSCYEMAQITKSNQMSIK